MKFKPEYLYIPSILFIIIGIAKDLVFLDIIGLASIAAMLIMHNSQIKTDKLNTISEAKEIFDKQEITHYFVGKDNLSAIGINEDQNEIILLSRKDIKSKFNYQPVPFNKIFEAKLIMDEFVVTSTSRTSQIGGAVVGGLAFGAVGAIVGGSGAKQHAQKEVRKINLELVLDDITSPLFNVCFMDEFMHIKTYDPKYKKYYEDANHWYKSLSVILKRNEINRNLS